MTPLDRYLSEHFLDEQAFAAACGLAPQELARMVHARLIPGPSYVVSKATLWSDVFGDLPAPGAKEGRHFRAAHTAWVERARTTPDESGLKCRFLDELQAALDAENLTLHADRDDVWEHFLKGTYGLCVVEADSARAIARKEALQERLAALRKRDPLPSREVLLPLIEAYDAVLMPFSPIDRPLSSRRHLIDELRRRIWERP